MALKAVYLSEEDAEILLPLISDLRRRNRSLDLQGGDSLENLPEEIPSDDIFTPEV